MGSDVEGFAVGDRVMAMTSGAFGEYFVVDSRVVLPVPANISWALAAATPVSFMTAHNALAVSGFHAGQSVLVHAATSGVGTTAIQIAKYLGASPVLGTSRSSVKLAQLAAVGLDIGVDLTGDFAAEVLAMTDGRGIDVVLDHLGGRYLGDSLRCLTMGGTLVSIGRLAGNIAELNLDRLAFKRHRVVGVTFRTRSVDECAEIADHVRRDLLEAIALGVLRPLIGGEWSVDEAPAALRELRANKHVGKLILRFDVIDRGSAELEGPCGNPSITRTEERPT
jgi:NADPH:quinone reductase-like Zn-dependent oxidoreductase